MKKLLEAVVCVAVLSGCMAAQSNELFIARRLGKTHGLRYDSPAEDSPAGWERKSLPVGNGWFGASVFGLPKSERIVVTDNTLLINGKLDGVCRPVDNSIGLTTAQARSPLRSGARRLRRTARRRSACAWRTRPAGRARPVASST